jgi:hypothetical protein
VSEHRDLLDSLYLCSLSAYCDHAAFVQCIALVDNNVGIRLSFCVLDVPVYDTLSPLVLRELTV